eukprot:gene8230-7568_t
MSAFACPQHTAFKPTWALAPITSHSNIAKRAPLKEPTEAEGVPSPFKHEPTTSIARSPLPKGPHEKPWTKWNR